ncbi:MAG: endonuclease III [Bacteroidia bacterium]|nr:MAG: endonuclease III [Bacteroidia bacterium]
MPAITRKIKDLQEKVIRIFKIFEKDNPHPTTELHYRNNYELLVAVILSAQCTDKRVNQITPALFDAFPDFQSLANATPDQVFQLIKSCSYPNSKAKNLVAMAKIIMEKYHGKIPKDLNELVQIPGIGRKTANVILSVAYDIPALAVDTHVFRVSERIGLTKNAKNPEQAEQQLLSIIPGQYLSKAHHWLILHGRYVCTAKNPKCDICKITNYCDYFAKKRKTNS